MTEQFSYEEDSSYEITPVEEVPEVIKCEESKLSDDFEKFKSDAEVCTDDEHSKAAEECEFVKRLNEEKARKCKFSSVKVSKGSRSVTIDRNTRDKFFEVVSGNLETFHKFAKIAGVQASNFSPSKVEFTVNGKVGPCSESHKNHLIGLIHEFKAKDDDHLKMEVFSDWFFWPQWATPTVYTANFNTCGESLSIAIHSYPDIEMGVQIELQLQNIELNQNPVVQTDVNSHQKKVKLPQNKKERREKASRNASLLVEDQEYDTEKVTDAVSIGGYYKFSGIEIEPKAVFSDVIETIKFVSTVPRKIKTFLGNIENEKAAILEQNRFNESHSSSLKLTIGKFSIRFQGGWVEEDGSHLCEYAYAIVIKASPFFGIEWKTDITAWILKTNPVGTAIGKIKDLLNDLGQEVLAIVFSIGAKVNLEPRFEFRKSHPDGLKVTGKGEIEVPGKLEIKLIKVNLNKWIFKVEAEISGSGESGLKFGVKVNSSGGFITGEWTGLKIQLVAKYKASVAKQKNGPPPVYKPVGDKFKAEEEPNVVKKKEKSVEVAVKIPGNKLFDDKKII